MAGERRLRAAKLAKLQTVPVLIRDYDEKQMRELSLVENIQRHDLNPLEEARAIRELMKQLKDKRVSVSLPSLRIDSVLKESLEETQQVKKSIFISALK